MRISDWSSDVCSSDLPLQCLSRDRFVRRPLCVAVVAPRLGRFALKKLAIALVALLVMAVVALLVLPSFWDWNGEKGRLAALVKQHTGRGLEIAGDVSLRLLPTPAFSAEPAIGRASWGERGGQ